MSEGDRRLVFPRHVSRISTSFSGARDRRRLEASRALSSLSYDVLAELTRVWSADDAIAVPLSVSSNLQGIEI